MRIPLHRADVCLHLVPITFAGGVSLLDVDTREDALERERREVCLRALGPCMHPVHYHCRCCRSETVNAVLRAGLLFSQM